MKYTEYDILYQNENKLNEIMKDTKETETLVALEMMKIFMRDDMENFAKVRKQILKGMEVDYFNKER
jgi:predicted sugar kinase